MKQKETKLTRNEKRLYDFFHANPDTALAYCMFAVIPPYDIKKNVIVGVHRVRRKMKAVDPAGRIVALPGYGYRYERVA